MLPPCGVQRLAQGSAARVDLSLASCGYYKASAESKGQTEPNMGECQWERS